MSSKKSTLYSMEFKKEVVEYAAKTNNTQAANRYGITKACVRNWRRIETRIDEEINRNGGKKTRFVRAGRKPKDVKFDENLAKWVRDKQEKNQRVPRRSVLEQARIMNRDPDFKSSYGWYQKFIKRHNLETRRKPRQKPLEDYNDDFLFDTLQKELFSGEGREDIQQLELFGAQDELFLGAHEEEHVEFN